MARKKKEEAPSFTASSTTGPSSTPEPMSAVKGPDSPEMSSVKNDNPANDDTLLDEPAPAPTPVAEEPTPQDATGFKRLDNGLVEGVEYPKHPNGRINWRGLVDPQFIFIRDECKAEVELLYKKKFEELTIAEVHDDFLCITLPGWRELAKLRGHNFVRYTNKVAQPGFVSVDCEIAWIGIPETKGIGELFCDGADATPDNTEGWYGSYLTTAACNRAFCRAVRNYLGIYVISKDEVGPKVGVERTVNAKTGGVDGFGPYAMLADILAQKGRTVEQLVVFLSKKNFEYEGFENWKKVEDVPKEVILKVVGIIQS